MDRDGNAAVAREGFFDRISTRKCGRDAVSGTDHAGRHVHDDVDRRIGFHMRNRPAKDPEVSREDAVDAPGINPAAATAVLTFGGTHRIHVTLERLVDVVDLPAYVGQFAFGQFVKTLEKCSAPLLGCSIAEVFKHGGMLGFLAIVFAPVLRERIRELRLSDGVPDVFERCVKRSLSGIRIRRPSLLLTARISLSGALGLA